MTSTRPPDVGQNMHQPPSEPPAAGVRGDAMDRQTLVGGLVVVLAAVVIGLAFVWSYVGALHEPTTFHDAHLGVVGAPGLAKRLAATDQFVATNVVSRRAAIGRIDDRKDLGAIVVGSRSIDVLVAGAAGRALKVLLEAELPLALRTAVNARTPIRVIDVKPLPANDPNGLTPFYLVLGIVVASFMGATTFALIFGLKPPGRRIWWRILGFAVMALGMGLGEVAIVNLLGPLRGHYVVLALIGLLLGTTVGTITVAFQALLGMFGTGVAILVFVVLGNPASGGPAANELLPGFWRTIGPYLPSGAGTDLVRNTVYFDGHATTRPLLVLFIWLLGALALAAVSTRVRGIGLNAPSQPAEPEAVHTSLATV